MKKKNLISLLFALATLLPFSAFAVPTDDDTRVGGSLATDSALIDAIASLRADVGKKMSQDSFLVAKYNLIVSRLIETHRLPPPDSIPDVDDINPILFRLIAPPTLYTSPMKRALTLAGDSTSSDSSLSADIALPGTKDLELLDELDHLLLLSYLKNPEIVKQTEERLMENASVSDETMKKSADNAALNVSAGETKLDPVTAANTDMVVKKPNFWKTGGSLSNQWAENYFSTNWYQGGTSNLTILSLLTLDANYNDKQKVTWNNRMEAKVGFYMNNFYKSEEEGRTKIQSNTDLLRFTSTLKLKAIRNWNYSAQLLAYTQMMNMYNGDETLKSTFLSPSYGQFSLGMDWAKTFKKGSSLSINIGAITYNFRYVMNDSVLQKSGYIPKQQRGKETEPTFHHYYYDYGTKVTIDFSWPISKNISYKTRFFYYTPFNAGNSGHHYVQSEWENTFNFQVSKYLSATLFFHARFDDSRTPDEKLKYFMFKEYLTLGFNYSW